MLSYKQSRGLQSTGNSFGKPRGGAATLTKAPAALAAGDSSVPSHLVPLSARQDRYSVVDAFAVIAPKESGEACGGALEHSRQIISARSCSPFPVTDPLRRSPRGGIATFSMRGRPHKESAEGCVAVGTHKESAKGCSPRKIQLLKFKCQANVKVQMSNARVKKTIPAMNRGACQEEYAAHKCAG